MEVAVLEKKARTIRTNSVAQLWWKGAPVSPEEYVHQMRKHCPADLHKYWWHPGVWALLTDEEKGEMKTRVP
jgi:hypothetical protein